MTARTDAPWWRKAFRRGYLDVYAHRDDESAARESSFVASQLCLTPGARLLDAGCGAGRHARAMARLGASVVGVDLSPDLLAEAVRRGGARYALADLRSLPFRDAAFAHVQSLFTSFGYFDDAGDRAHIGEVRRVLRTGGTFVLDFLNAPFVEATLVAESERRVGERVVRERRRIVGRRVEKTVEFDDGERWTESVRLYRRGELVALFGASGLRVAAVHGDLAGGGWSDRSARLVLTAVAA